MTPASSGRVGFWRGSCFVLAGVATVEAAGLVLALHTLPVGSSARPALATTPAAPAALAAARPGTDDPAAPGPGSLSSRVPTAHGHRHRARDLEDEGYSLARTDPEAAFRALAGLGVKADRIALAHGIFDSLAQGDPTQALASARRMPPGAEREAALTALLDRWSVGVDESPEDRAHRVVQYGLDAGLGLTLLQGDTPRPDLAALWAQQLTSGKAQSQMLGQAAAVQVATDPALAASYGGGLDGDDRLAFNDLLVRAWTRTQPDAAWQWSSGLDNPAAREQAQTSSILALSQQDPQAAAARLALLPDDASRQATLGAVAAAYANKNTDAALAWAQTLPSTDLVAASAGIASVAPVGIGVTIQIDAQGYPVVNSILPNGAAGQGGQIHPGDRIVGVNGGNGQFVNVQQMDLGQVVGMVRGTAGSVVQLQVAPALPGGGFASPVVIPVVRQQIKHGS